MDTFHETKYNIWAALGQLGSLKFIYQGALLFENLKFRVRQSFPESILLQDSGRTYPSTTTEPNHI